MAAWPCHQKSELASSSREIEDTCYGVIEGKVSRVTDVDTTYGDICAFAFSTMAIIVDQAFSLLRKKQSILIQMHYNITHHHCCYICEIQDTCYGVIEGKLSKVADVDTTYGDICAFAFTTMGFIVDPQLFNINCSVFYEYTIV